MSTMDDYLRKLGDGWEGNDERSPMDDFTDLLGVVRILMSGLSETPSQMLNSMAIPVGFATAAFEEKGLDYMAMVGFAIFAIVVENERRSA